MHTTPDIDKRTYTYILYVGRAVTPLLQPTKRDKKKVEYR